MDHRPAPTRRSREPERAAQVERVGFRGQRPARGLERRRQHRSPASGEYAWTHIKGQTLSVNILTIAKDGTYAMQVYDRTVSPQGMQLVFKRIVDGRIVRTVDGKLIKFAE